MKRIAGSLALLLALGACGQQRDLRLAEGMTPPPVPYGQEQPDTPEQLLDPGPEAVPLRSVELRRQSEEREDDPFDLPPEG
ncbi:conserved hypothetical protein [Altererythrobacter sp. B11]|uniref:hypothetical protein n=1 Tax=Altererythrobacter sp. B11 TaxID=2060312 RepID=UPI000DC708CA|nr:hypothetical protein [Altererythrobacter sp. B11]BBC72257.1 conserved hypothetical protein [Altererythrobacter sp. B11]